MIIWPTIIFALSTFIVVLYFKSSHNIHKQAINCLFISSMISLITSIYWTINDNPTTLCNISWFSNSLQDFTISLSIDFTFLLFASTALFVTWSIIEFSYYYMNNDPNKNAFINTLVIFLLFMLLLTSANNLFILFIGWEGVGIMSFVLISWWHSRSDANSAALQAIIYNRIGDSGILILLILSIYSFNSWNLNEVIFCDSHDSIPLWAKLGIILAAVGKSAQFSLHPWLPSAMEGPTPVSALLHSSTMVVAGVFLLIRTHPLLSNNPWILSLIVIIGGFTSLYAATAAFNQFDIKKIVAYSTTSQLGLMVFSIGLNIPWLALYHICTHAFFKALLFLCSGSIIHSLNNEQDLRKMSLAGWKLPLTSAAFSIGSLSLMGFPFLAGFYSKDLILEAAQQSNINIIGTILALIATLLTSAYSFRTMLFLFLNNNNGNEINPLSEESINQIGPLVRLVIGVLLAGWGFSLALLPSLPILLPIILKSLPLISFLLLLFIFLTTQVIWLHPPHPLFSFGASNWFYVPILHPLTTFHVLFSSIKGVLRTLDQGWTSLYGPAGSVKSFTLITSTLRLIHRARISLYLIYTLIFTLCLYSLSVLFSSS
uniref:NADH-ubiquinone oxidoreductase chain 5 n=1 Tax=Amphiura sinicola TaxID=2705302 RepID=A0A6C0FCN5_9ECHI|nr:NADH dehydrogenase subunit 5 [Amphiura sinicola]QHT54216.1 NADH dehydrogenase subunit 5 [Amphiura sinicola]